MKHVVFELSDAAKKVVSFVVLSALLVGMMVGIDPLLDQMAVWFPGWL
jgi:hypothetical protein